MKVLLINNCHYKRGGSETVYFSTAKLLKELGHEVVFFSFADEKNEYTGDKNYFIKRDNALRKTFSYFNNKKAAEALDSILNKEHFDIAHVHLIWGGMTASIIPILHKHGVPLVHSVHDYRMICPCYTFRNGKGKVCEQCLGGYYYRCFLNLCSKRSIAQSFLMAAEMYYRNHKWHPTTNMDGIIYVSNFARIKHEEFDRRFSEVPNIVLYNSTAIRGRYKPIEESDDYYLYYGRLSGEKGVGTLIDAFNNIPEKKLYIVGTGPIVEQLKRKANNNIRFLGFKTGEELYSIVGEARFIIVPSEWYENNPMTIIEAFSMGVPVIGANIGGIPEIIEDCKTGFLFESGNLASLESVIRKSDRINNVEYSHLSDNAFRFAVSNFNTNGYAEKLVDFYKQVIVEFKNKCR